MVNKIKIKFIAGFGPVVSDSNSSRNLYKDVLGLDLEELEGGYMHSKTIEGCKGFGLWPIAQAAEECFGEKSWPDSVPKPQAWLEFEVDDLRSASEAMSGNGYHLLIDGRVMPYGQTVSRFLSPEGIIIGLTITPWLRS